MSEMKLSHITGWTANTRTPAIVGSKASSGQKNQFDARLAVQTIQVKLSTGNAHVDIYWPNTSVFAPLIIIAHGFFRNRHNMSGWGMHLAREGFVAVVPDLPAWSDHPRNGRFITNLHHYLCTIESWSQQIDPSRVGLIGFSAGGLATLLSAADDPSLSIWVGLDPVDWKGIGTRVAPQVNCRSVVLTAEPSACNAHGNASDIITALPHCEHFKVNGAVHVDAEWPTDRLAEVVCGRSTFERRNEFHRRATAALRETLLSSPVARSHGNDQ